MSWLRGLDESILNYLESLKIRNSKFKYSPARKSLTVGGKNLELGFSCYALKIHKLLNSSTYNSDVEMDEWANYINSFQKSHNKYVNNAFVDESYMKVFQKTRLLSDLGYPMKSISNYLLKTNYKSNTLKIDNYLRAETKQSISTLSEIEKRNDLLYINYPQTEKDISNFLQNLNWSFPWSSGAQFSALCVFSKTQLKSKDFEISKNSLINFSEKLVHAENGFYYLGKNPTQNELINGAMKILTGFDWLGVKIHYPEKIIDYCLNYDLHNGGCDIVDVVYVLYRCSKETTYRKFEVISYLENILSELEEHYKSEEGGFSYYKTKNQTHYYDVKIIDGINQSDIHGTLLCLWAVVMIMDLTEKDYFEYKTLKP
jgi:hypothetical protein